MHGIPEKKRTLVDYYYYYFIDDDLNRVFFFQGYAFSLYMLDIFSKKKKKYDAIIKKKCEYDIFFSFSKKNLLFVVYTAWSVQNDPGSFNIANSDIERTGIFF